jgi:proteasome lid subunit RPN8/RPN11
MIRIEREPWDCMLAHARNVYPDECCGALLGRSGDDGKQISVALPLENVFAGSRRERYEIRPENLLAAQNEARRRGLDLIGVYHSHPDRDAYFSATDLANSCPWYSFVILALRGGECQRARSFLADASRQSAREEELVTPVRVYNFIVGWENESMDYDVETPFDNLESAQQFVELLAEAIEEARREVDAEMAAAQPERRLQALQLVSFKLGKLSGHMGNSRRILNDLRTLRRLLYGERAAEAEVAEVAEPAEPNWKAAAS